MPLLFPMLSPTGASGTGKSHTLLGSKHQPGGLLSSLLQDVFSRFDDKSCALTVSVEELHNVSMCVCQGGGGVVWWAGEVVGHGGNHLCAPSTALHWGPPPQALR
jgi:hypothetical protein